MNTAAVISTFWPGRTSAVSLRICHAVSAANGSAPASTWVRLFGLSAKCLLGAVTYSA